MVIGSDEWSRLIINGAESFGLDLKPVHTRLFAQHAEQLLKWNEKTNLTAITRATDIALNHFLDSLVPASLIPSDSDMLDVGTGGGFPGLPLHMVIPGLRTTLVDASRKKVSFLRQVIRELRLERIRAFHVRAEELHRHFEPPCLYDVIVSRAFSNILVLVHMTLDLLKPQGRIIAFKGTVPAAEIEDLRTTVEGSFRTKLTLSERRYALPGLKSTRTLLILGRES
jgi:16S rRNA (guanine527-N7)-methyltransferase